MARITEVPGRGEPDVWQPVVLILREARVQFVKLLLG
jgi:hypothetical protein